MLYYEVCVGIIFTLFLRMKFNISSEIQMVYLYRLELNVDLLLLIYEVPRLSAL